jgi:3-methyladenine DNA glycosylase Tag
LRNILMKILDLLQDAGIIRNKLKLFGSYQCTSFLKSKKNLKFFRNTFGFCNTHSKQQET